MSEENATTADRLDVRLDRLEQGQYAIRESIAELKGGFEQMDKRLSNAESLQRWAIGLIITSWLTLVGLSITMLFKLL